MKKYFSFLLIICLFFPCIILLSACDLTHKHYYNNIGRCSCNYDSSKSLTFNNQTKEYTINDNVINGYESGNINYFYYNFTAVENLPYGIEFETNSPDNVEFDRIDIYYNAAQHLGPATNLYGEVSYNSNIQAGKQIFFKIIFKNSGNINFTIKPITNPQTNPNL